MNDKNIKLAYQWLKKARNDLIAARHIFSFDPCPTDIVCFHSQQVIEKSLKAFLVFNHIPYPKIHELVRLLELTVIEFPEVEKFRDDFAEISEYAVEVRYPGEWEDPTHDDARHAIKIAEEVMLIVEKKLGQPGLEFQ